MRQHPQWLERGVLGCLMAMCLVAAAPATAERLDVRVDGLEGAPLANVLALLAIYQERQDDDLTAARIQVLHRRAPDQIEFALSPFGYYRVEVDANLTAPVNEAGTWVATYRVVPGPRIRIGSVRYQVTGAGADDPAFPRVFPLAVGDVLLHSEYERAREDLRRIAAREGYRDHRLVAHQVLIDPVAYEALVDFELDTGPRYHFGEVSFRQDLLDEAFLDRFVTIRPGEVYNADRLLGLQGRLLGTQYFERVEIVPLDGEGPDPQTVPIEVVAHRNKANQYRVGLGYATDVGPRASFEWRRRYLGRHGHRLSTEMSLAPSLQRFSADYRIPIGDPVRDFISIRPAFESYDTASRKGDLLRLQAAHSIVTPSGWRRTAGVDFRQEDYVLDGGRRETVLELIPNISWAKTVSDDPIYTTRGHRLRYTLLASQAPYVSATAQIKWIRGFADDYRLIARTDLGATLADSLEDLPASRRFYAGGDSSIRGWGLDALGPTEVQGGRVIGGRYMAVGSLELERRIQGPWSAALFTDFGNAFDPDYDQQWNQSVGAGLRWQSPIGQVRADIAFGLTKDDRDDGGLPPARLHLIIGPDL